jgi:GT2 family glycosyltransferase
MSLRAAVVIPSLDSPWIDRTLAGLRVQAIPGPEIEVIVVGRDGTGLVPRDGSLRFLASPEPLNPAQARNRGVATTTAETILFLDADVLPDPAWARELAAALGRVPVAGGAVTFDAGADRWALADNIASFHELLPDRAAEDATTRPLGSLNLGVRRAAWERVGPFDETLPTSEDFDWILRARAAGLATAFVPTARVEHLPARPDKAALLAHATWYGRHFNDFRAKHPGLLDRGPTWRSRDRLRRSAALKSWLAALAIFRRHPALRRSWRALPGVVAFRRAWYQAVVDTWPTEPGA